jgi:carbon storage regulator CsrA
MLVLSRKSRESVFVGGVEPQSTLKLTVLEIGRGKVKLGFEADPNILVHRWEVWERIADNRLGAEEEVACEPATAMAFDVDGASLVCLEEALPGWQIHDMRRSMIPARSDRSDWSEVQLLVVGCAGNGAETLALCQLLSSRLLETGQARANAVSGCPPNLPRGAPLLVLVPRGQEGFVDAALQAGAYSCLMLPIFAQDVVSMLRHARAGNQPGRHTRSGEHAQSEDCWRDVGGQG